jgi:hypothetical protein
MQHSSQLRKKMRYTDDGVVGHGARGGRVEGAEEGGWRLPLCEQPVCLQRASKLGPTNKPVALVNTAPPGLHHPTQTFFFCSLSLSPRRDLADGLANYAADYWGSRPLRVPAAQCALHWLKTWAVSRGELWGVGERIGLEWIGLDWIGLDWIGVEWRVCLEECFPPPPLPLQACWAASTARAATTSSSA